MAEIDINLGKYPTNIIEEKKWIKIPNFFNKEELEFLKIYTKNKIYSGFETDSQSPHNPSFYEDPVMNSFLVSKKTLCEKVAGCPLFDTYTYWRGYIHGATLDSHRDRPACEISVTANIENCGTKWPIHMNKEWLNMDEGDAIMYLGFDVLHGRERFKGIYNAQVFFHYVNAKGNFTEHKYDQVRKAGENGLLK